MTIQAFRIQPVKHESSRFEQIEEFHRLSVSGPGQCFFVPNLLSSISIHLEIEYVQQMSRQSRHTRSRTKHRIEQI